MVGAEAHAKRIMLQILLPNELAYIHHAVLGHIGCPGVTDVRIVLPNHRLRIGAMKVQKFLQGVNHMAIPHIPGLRPASDHRSVIMLGIRSNQGIEFRTKLRFPAAMALVSSGPSVRSTYLLQQANHFFLTTLAKQAGRDSVRLRVFTIGLKTGESMKGLLQKRRTRTLQIPDDLLHRFP
ncbi:hypothetical protein D1872_221220 [compost metagenome]